LCFLVAVTAIGGGVALIAAPDGSIVHMPVSELRASPFSTFLIPGLLLLGVVGGSNLLAAILLLRRARFAHHVAFVAGAALLVWISTEIVMLQSFSLLQPTYFLIAVAIMVRSAIYAVRHR